MRLWQLLHLAWRQAWGNPLRSCCTIIAVAAGMALVGGVLALDGALSRALSGGSQQLLVMQAHRHCPLSSWLPAELAPLIAEVPEVDGVRPLRLLPSHCGTALDVVVLRGVPPEDPGAGLRASHGDLAAWRQQPDGAAVGSSLARRRGWQLGEKIEVAGLDLQVLAITDGPHPADGEQLRVHLSQLAAHGEAQHRQQVTSFQVSLQPGADLQRVARAIDERVAAAGFASSSRSERAAMLAAARDLVTLAEATRLLALASALAVGALVANALLLGLLARRRAMAILAAIGFGLHSRCLLVISEGMMLAFLGALAGAAVVALVLSLFPPGIASEGWSIQVRADGRLLLLPPLALLIALLAALLPCWHCARLDLSAQLRTGAAA
ncbi:MAG: FtsX-like permease family protein [Planctomycetota bacterium]|nr:MAG: FtsX-like permease family protein [Planctomycetota bacterium]